MEALSPKTILATAAIALFALAMIPTTAYAGTGTYNCNKFSLNLSDFMVNPSNPIPAPYTLVLTGQVITSKGGLDQGPLSGTFNGNPVAGGYSFNTATGKLLAKVLGPGFEIDLAFVTAGAPAGFTFIGMYHIVGQQPMMLLGPLGASNYCSA